VGDLIAEVPALASRRDGPEFSVLLASLLDLTLSLQHARWNCYGAGFRDLYTHLLDVTDVVRSLTDRIAEHSVAAGVSPDGRSRSVVASSVLPPMPPGPILVDVAIAGVATAIDQVLDVGRRDITAFGGNDHVAHALLVTLVATLERHRWMFVAEFSANPPASPPQPIG
jgi:starvation-inducible DNA-binding protein